MNPDMSSEMGRIAEQENDKMAQAKIEQTPIEQRHQQMENEAPNYAAKMEGAIDKTPQQILAENPGLKGSEIEKILDDRIALISDTLENSKLHLQQASEEERPALEDEVTRLERFKEAQQTETNAFVLDLRKNRELY